MRDTTGEKVETDRDSLLAIAPALVVKDFNLVDSLSLLSVPFGLGDGWRRYDGGDIRCPRMRET
jgi:hypothetical protein